MRYRGNRDYVQGVSDDGDENVKLEKRAKLDIKGW